MTLGKVFSAKHSDLLEGLTHGFRAATEEQIGQWLWKNASNPAECARNVLRTLEGQDLVTRFQVMVSPQAELSEPVVSWRAGEPEPDFGPPAHRLRVRWNRPAVRTCCVIATQQAARLFGGHGGRFPRESEETHDIHVAALYLRLREIDPEAAAHWIFEDEIREHRGHRAEKLPDVLLELPAGKKIIEFGGAYKKEKLRAFHRYCESLNLPYEVW